MGAATCDSRVRPVCAAGSACLTGTFCLPGRVPEPVSPELVTMWPEEVLFREGRDTVRS